MHLWIDSWINKKAEEIRKIRERKNNGQFTILKVWGIFLVVYGHVGNSMSLFMGVMFHMPLFIFISGYFYSPKSEDGILAFLKKRFCRLVIPYFAWNLFYGVL